MAKLLFQTNSIFRLALAACVLGSGAASLPAGAQTAYQAGPDSQVQPGVPQGKMFSFPYTASPRIYPGIQSTIWVYVPAEYDPGKPACLCVGLDGPGDTVNVVFDNLIAKKEMPVTIGVFISPGQVNAPGTNNAVRYDRCYEFDSTNDNFDRFLTTEILPAVEAKTTPDGKPIRISDDPNDHMIYGGSSGGVCAFTAAWQHPDLFRRVFTAIGTYVGMRGADQYPTLVRKTEPKPIRIFLQDGAQDTWNPLFDNWYTQNRSMEESLRFAGYDVNHNWGLLGHEGSQANSLFPDVCKWLWRDYPAPIPAGVSGNSMLNSVLAPAQGWQPVALPFAPTLLASLPGGDVALAHGAFVSRLPASGGSPTLDASTTGGGFYSALACGPDGSLYTATTHGEIWRNPAHFNPHSFPVLVASGLAAQGLTVTNDGSVYVSVPGAHSDMPSRLYGIAPGAKPKLLDSGVPRSAGVVLTPDHTLLFLAEHTTHWIDSYVVQPNGTLTDKQRFYWLHTAESDDDSNEGAGATDLAEDTNGDLFVATRMGVQVCDRNGRVEGILTLPAGAVTSLCFGGPDMHTLFLVCGGHLYRRTLQATGVAGFAPVQPLPGFGAG